MNYKILKTDREQLTLFSLNLSLELLTQKT